MTAAEELHIDVKITTHVSPKFCFAIVYESILSSLRMKLMKDTVFTVVLNDK